MTGVIAALDGGTYYHDEGLRGPRYAAAIDRIIYLGDLATCDLGDVDVLIVTCRMHPGPLKANRDKLQAFARAGGLLVTMGETRQELWLDGVAWQTRPTNWWWWLETASLGLATPQPDHGLWRWLTPRDCEWHYHGILTPPAGVTPLVTLPDGSTLLYEDRVTFAPGRAIVTTLDPFYHHGSHFMPATTRFLDGFLPWLRTEADTIHAARRAAAPATGTSSTMADTITVHENSQPITFTFAEILKYHGFGYPGGVAHAFKIMQRAFPLLDDGKPVERRDLSMDTAFPGPGARDAFEMVTRMVTAGRYNVDLTLASDDVLRSPKGRYLFRFHYRGKSVELTLRPGLVRDEFIALGAKDNRTAAEEERLVWLKNDMAERLLSLPAEQVYDAKVA